MLEYVNKNKALELLDADNKYDMPWFGQLMRKPQMMAYIIQVNYWLEKFF